MSFLYLFDMVEFDEKGQVCGGEKCDLQQSYSNFLYLLSKYNQIILQDEKMPIPVFFKEELSNVLTEIENSSDLPVDKRIENFKANKKKVLENCVSRVKLTAENSDSDLDIVAKLNDYVSLKDKTFADKFKNATNRLQLEYIITLISGKVFENVLSQVSNSDFMQDKLEKSKVFKDIIRYNGLVSTAEKVKENKLTTEDLKVLVG